MKVIILVVVLALLLFLYIRQRRASRPRKVALVSTMRKPEELFVWLRHHRAFGISHFFIRTEDTPGLEDFLSTQQDISFEIGRSDAENNYMSVLGRQTDFANRSLKNAREMGYEWIIHIDADELLDGSLDFLFSLEPHYKCLKIENAEATYEENNESCFSTQRFVKCSAAGSKCRAYANGKAGGRTEYGVKVSGVHDFYYSDDASHTYAVPFDTLHVLHFDSCSFGTWAEKFKHYGKNKKDDIPFSYYNESITATGEAFKTYKKHVVSDDDVSGDNIFLRT